MKNVRTHDIETEYVPKDLFELHIQNLRDKSSSDERLNDERIKSVEKLLSERMDTIVALMEKNLAEYKVATAKTDGKINVIAAQLEHAIDSLTIAINSNEKRLDDFRQDIQEKQSRYFARWSILTAIIVGAVQVIISVVLHFW